MSDRLYGGVRAGRTQLSLAVLLRDEDTGKGLPGLAAASVAASYWRQGASPVAIPTAALASVTAAHTAGGWAEGQIVASSTPTQTSTATTNDINAATTETFTHDSGAGVVHAAVVSLHIDRAGSTGSAVTYGGAAMSLLIRATGASMVTELWGLVNPAGLTNGVRSVTWTVAGGACNGYVSVRTFVNVETFGTTQTASGSSTSATLTIASAAGRIVLDALTVKSSPTASTAGTSHYNVLDGNGGTRDVGAEWPGAASVSPAWTLSPSTPWAYAAVNLVPAAGAATGAPGMYRLDVPDAALATGADWVVVAVTASGAIEYVERLALETRRSLRASQAYPGFTVFLRNTDGTAHTGGTVTGQRSLDGGTLAGLTNAVTEIGGGLWKVNLAAADTAGVFACYLFTATGALPLAVQVTLEP